MARIWVAAGAAGSEVGRALHSEGFDVELAGPGQRFPGPAQPAPDGVLVRFRDEGADGFERLREIGAQQPSAVRALLVREADLEDLGHRLRAGERAHFLVEPWGGPDAAALLWRLLADRRWLELLGERSSQGLSAAALARETGLRRGTGGVGPLVGRLSKLLQGRSRRMVGGLLERTRRSLALVVELGGDQRLAVELP
ncbi:MAG: hypothetical protein ACYCWW_09795 [Deltaproteobacteria bacterium]